ncbi:MAG: N-(5'-phosphoribosyl)anthranilate isomerase [Gemmatimonadota bacterium]
MRRVGGGPGDTGAMAFPSSGGVAVKICGLRRRSDALAADEAGADYVGAVVSSGFGRSISPEAAARIFEGVGAVRVAVLVDEDPAEAARKAEVMSAGVIQLHGHEPTEVVEEIRRRGSWRIWKAVRVGGGGPSRALEEAKGTVARYAPVVDGILLEGYREGVTGGGGVGVDPGHAMEIRAWMPDHCILILAGGLTPDSVAGAVARVRPEVVDVSSGVEAELGKKDHGLIRAFLREAKKGAEPHRRLPEIEGD